MFFLFIIIHTLTLKFMPQSYMCAFLEVASVASHINLAESIVLTSFVVTPTVKYFRPADLDQIRIFCHFGLAHQG